MFDKNLMKLPGMRAVLAALAVLALVQAGCIAGQALFLGAAISELWAGEGLTVALGDAAAFLACFTVLHIARFAQDALLERAAASSVRSLNDQLLDAALDPDVQLARATGPDTLASALADGADDIEAYLRIVPPKVIGLLALTVPLLACEFIVDWPSGIIITVMIPVIIFFMQLLGKQARSRSERQYAAYTRLSNRFMDTLRGMRVIQSLGAERAEEAGVREHSESLRTATMRTLATATLSSAVLDFCATFAVAGVAMMLAFRLMDGSISLFTGLVALILAPECLAPLRSFAADYHASLDGRNALKNHLALIGQATRATGREVEGEPFTWDDDSVLSFDDVSFAYPGTNGGVSGVTFAARAGQRVGLVGASGSGKTTLANLVAGLSSPDAGEVRVNGVTVELTSPRWRSQVRYIPQEPYLFRATLMDNLRFYNPAATRGQVLEAVREVGLEKLVDELPDGLDTLLGEGARGLSGGQAHRVALARVLLDGNARILVFDEPTAHLDIETELDLKEPMTRLMAGKLTFFATHRLHWLDDMDLVISLEGGRAALDAPGEAVAPEAHGREMTR